MRLWRPGTCVTGLRGPPRESRHRSGIVTFSTGRAPSDTALMRALLTAGVAVSVRYTSGVGGIRVSCHHYNTLTDLDLLLTTVQAWQRRPHSPQRPVSRPELTGARSAVAQVARQRALIDALDDDLMGLITARGGVSRGICVSRLEGAMSRTDLAREREIVERFHHRLGQDGTRLALELLRMCKGDT
ncbi:hypothetical protein [Streptomyces sp. NPDC000878]